MRRELFTLIFLLGVALVSGCISQKKGEIPTGNGIIIKDFYFDYSPIYANDSIGLNLEVQNIGGGKGYVKKVTVFGVDYQSGSSGSLKWGLPADETFILDESSPELPVPLAPPDPTTGFEGESWSYSWTPIAPGGIKTPTNFDFQVRVEYNYSTTYTGTIRIIESSYLKTLTPEERDKLIKEGGVIESVTTGGPMSVSAASGRHFIVQQPGTQERTIRFKVTNVGSGYPFDQTLDNTENLYKVRIVDHVGLKDCDSDFRMSRGKTGTFSCKIEVPGTDTLVNKMDKKFSITLEYDYYVDSSTSITVNPVYVGEKLVPGVNLTV